MKVVTADEMRRIEQQCEHQGLSVSSLMQLAGQAVCQEVIATSMQGPVVFLIGPGNNGGAGIVAATRLCELGRPVCLDLLARRDVPEGIGECVLADEDADGRILRQWLERSDVIVDALLGMGQSRHTEGALGRIVRQTNETRRKGAVIIAVDVPTGIDSDTGKLLGEAVKADRTVCMGFAKPGVFVYPGAGCAGRVMVRSLGIPPSFGEISRIVYPSDEDIAAMLPRRDANSNKGSFGRVLVVGGSSAFRGAPALVSLAAYRVGAGLLEVLVPETVQESVAAHVMECIFAPGRRVDDQLGSESLPEIMTAAAKAKSIVLGPGMGLSDRTRALIGGLLEEWKSKPRIPVVVDADALSALGEIQTWWSGQRDFVLTPHPGEMGRLTGPPVESVQRDRLSTARTQAERWNQTVVLKGAGTIVASPDGHVAINSTGGPNLATAGAGDVLSGIVGGLLAQGCPPWQAAVAGTYLHGKAGDLLRETVGDAGTLAGDLTGAVPRARSMILSTMGDTL
ncbi:MAG: bifunctional ADP-dependent NAD(P)H-hydrate dehydratase/NAD(P)H-hydrate epimerase [Steroidobacteraceae bacterium]